MKKLLKYTLVGISIVVLVSILLILFLVIAENPIPRILHTGCYVGGGEWTVLPTTAMDLCGQAVGDSALTPGCYCGEDKCWTGKICVEEPFIKCRNSGGRWRTFSNGCADFCGTGPECTMALIDGCDCGENKCWDWNSCVDVDGINESSLLPNCDYNRNYLSKDECICKDNWIMHSRSSSVCTQNDETTFFCRKIENHIIIGELYVNFEPGTTLGEAEEIINKYGGKIVQYTCWFENRDIPYVIATVKEGTEKDYINQIQKESIVKSAHERRLSTVQ